MADKQLPEDMLDDLALLLDNSDKLKSIIDFPKCVGVGLEGLGRRIAAELSFEFSKVRDILYALWRFKKFFEDREESPAASIAWLTACIETRTPPEWRQGYNDKWLAFSQTFCDLMVGIGDDHPVMIAMKAQSLVYAHQHVFLGARLITDVRPVFNDNASEIDELVITHMLSVDYTDGTQRNKVLTVAMDEQDIAILHSQCERAATKILTLKNKLKGFPLVVIPDIAEDDE